MISSKHTLFNMDLILSCAMMRERERGNDILAVLSPVVLLK
jgi:hypothetical protein